MEPGCSIVPAAIAMATLCLVRYRWDLGVLAVSHFAALHFMFIYMLDWTLFLQRWDWGWAGGIAEAAEILLWAAAHLRLPIL